jgi:hypothetical protein
MLDPLIDLTCLHCGQRYRARATSLFDPNWQACEPCARGERPRPPRPFRWRGWWRRLKRSLFRGDWTY